MNAVTSVSGTYRFTRTIALIAGFALESMIASQFSTTHRARALRVSRWSKRILRSLNIELSALQFESIRAGLLVSNHLSYVDALVVASAQPSLFITSVEVMHSGWIGQICKLAGCVFVERRKITSLSKELSSLDEALTAGVPLVVFPEGTSTDGSKILPFRSSLFECAVRANIPVHVACIRYLPSPDGVAYYGEMNLLPHLWQLCQSGEKKTAEISYLNRLETTHYAERKVLASQSRELILGAYVSRT